MREGGAVSGWPGRGKERFREINYFRRKFLICSGEADTVTVLKSSREMVDSLDCLQWPAHIEKVKKRLRCTQKWYTIIWWTSTCSWTLLLRLEQSMYPAIIFGSQLRQSNKSSSGSEWQGCSFTGFVFNAELDEVKRKLDIALVVCCFIALWDITC